MHDKNQRLLITIVACISVIAVIAVLTISLIIRAMDDKTMEKYNREKSTLEYEKTQLLLKRDKVKDDILSELGPHAFLTLLLNSLDEEFVNKFYEDLSKYSMDEEGDNPFCATLLLSPEELPGMEGKISVEKFNWYLERGYSYALVYDGSVDLSEYLANMYTLILERDIDFPRVICYYGSKKDAILNESDKVILEGYGIGVAASMKGNGIMVEQEMYDGVYSPGILGWNTINVSSNTFNYAMNKGGNFGFIFGNKRDTTSIWRTSSYVALDNSEWHRALLRMLDRVETNAQDEKVIITDYSTGQDLRREYLERYEEIKPTLLSSLEAIDVRLNEIEKQLSEISDKYKR